MLKEFMEYRENQERVPRASKAPRRIIFYRGEQLVL